MARGILSRRARERLFSTVWGGAWGLLVGGVIVAVASQLSVRHDLMLPQPEARPVETPAGSEFDQARPETDPAVPGEETQPSADVAAAAPVEPERSDGAPTLDTSPAAAPRPSFEGPATPERPAVPQGAEVALTEREGLRPETSGAPEATAPLPPGVDRPADAARDVPPPPEREAVPQITDVPERGPEVPTDAPATELASLTPPEEDTAPSLGAPADRETSAESPASPDLADTETTDAPASGAAPEPVVAGLEASTADSPEALSEAPALPDRVSEAAPEAAAPGSLAASAPAAAPDLAQSGAAEAPAEPAPAIVAETETPAEEPPVVAETEPTPQAPTEIGVSDAPSEEDVAEPPSETEVAEAPIGPESVEDPVETEVGETDTRVTLVPVPEPDVSTATERADLQPAPQPVPRRIGAEDGSIRVAQGSDAPGAMPGVPAITIGQRVGTLPGSRLAEAPTTSPAAASERPTNGPALVAHRRAFESSDDRARLAIVLVHEGTDLPTPAALEALPADVSFAVYAGADNAGAIAAAYRSTGREIVLIPALPEGAQPQDVEVALQSNFAVVDEAVAVMDPGYAGFMDSRLATGQVVAVISETGHGLITAPQGLNSAQQIAGRFNVPSALLFDDLGAGTDAASVSRALDRAAFRARQEEGVILLGQADDATLAGLSDWLQGRNAQSLVLAPVSAVLAPDMVAAEASPETAEAPSTDGLPQVRRPPGSQSN